MGSLLTAQQQDLPRWVTEPPASTETEKKAMAGGASLDEARHIATGLLVSQLMTNQYEPGSYQYQLLSRGLAPIEQHTATVKAAEKSSMFRTLKQEEGDEVCYVLCEVTQQDYRTFCDSLYYTLMADARNQMERAESLRREGDLFTALGIYSQTIEGLTPVLHRSLQSGEGDLLTRLHDGYLHCLDGIGWQFERSGCYMVPGEEVPVELWVKATYQGKAVPGLPVTFSLSGKGAVKAGPITDVRGRAMAHVTRAPQEASAQLTVQLNVQKLGSMPQHIFSAELPQYLNSHLQKAQLTLTAFDPIPCYYLMPDERLSDVVADSIHAVMQRHGYKVASQKGDADLVVTTTFDCTAEGAPTTGKYPLQSYSARMTVGIEDRRRGKPMAHAELPALKLTLSTSTPDAQLHGYAQGELMKRLSAPLDAQVGSMKYDKREVMYAAGAAVKGS